jgi:hypothetical protein
MGLKNKEANPLAVFNMRKMDFCPPHFESITFDLKSGERAITDWIYENTEGRFYFGQDANRLSVRVGFEVHSEASYFAMFLPTINTFGDGLM